MKKSMSLIRKRKIPSYKYLAVFFFAMLILNPWTAVKLDPSPPLSIQTFNQILVSCLILYSSLLFLIYFKINFDKQIYLSVLVVFVSLIIPFIGMEILLRTSTLMDQIDSPNPSYIPKYMRDKDIELEQNGFITKEGFRTSENVSSLIEKLKKDQGCKVVVLGDSFIWGSGLKTHTRWPDKLSTLINCNVYPFGKNGWTTIEQFGFYENFLLDLDFDYLLVGIVENDPHPRGTFLNHNYEPEIYVRTNWGILQIFGLNSFHHVMSNLSYSYDYFSQLLSNIITPLISTSGSISNPPIKAAGYPAWRDRLFEDDVYSIWENVLKDFTNFSKHPLGFVLTPTAGNESGKKLWFKINNTMFSLEVPYVNLYEETSNAFSSKLRPRKYWANNADPHPGNMQTSIYAKGSIKVLKDLGYEEK